MDLNKKHKILTATRGAVDLKIIGLLAAGLILALVTAMAVAQGNIKEAYLYILIVVAFGVFSTMGRSYWLFIPMAMIADLPAVPLGGVSIKLGELWIAVSLLFLLSDHGLKGKGLKLVKLEVLPAYFYTAWAFVIYVLNPVGLSSMGAGAGGARFYTMIGISLCAIVILLNQKLSNQQAFRVLTLILFGMIAGNCWTLAVRFFPAAAILSGRSVNEGAAGFYGWEQILAVTPHFIVILLVARYSLREMLDVKHWWVIGVMVVCLALGLLSGKRSLTMLMLIYPMLGGLLRREFMVVAAAVALSSLLLFGAVLGHRDIFELPKTAQRVLSVFPSDKWDWDVESSADNSFRDTLNKYALRKVEDKPWLGHGLEADFNLLWYLKNNPGQVMEEGDHILGLTYSANSSWHNTWLGITADFGIPGAILWAMIWIQVIRLSLRYRKYFDKKDWRHTLCLVILLWTLGDIIRSWQFGHSAINFWQVSWRLGLLMALKNGILADMASAKQVLLAEESAAESNRRMTSMPEIQK